MGKVISEIGRLSGACSHRVENYGQKLQNMDNMCKYYGSYKTHDDELKGARRKMTGRHQ